ncbi:uncharacterized protein LOC115996122 [Ipomoea triloba]|uniref:uncharacterized protein LOC115996122 n=1 Tax=Ipomoea triloba TaxID=35885 RepID=UPI00125D8086|nr:uncharacterized protein LOC115996122 [Ipomoea triloba]
MAVQNMITNGCRRRIGNGLDTRIGTDPWLHDNDNPYVRTLLLETICEAPVSSLMNMQVYENPKMIGSSTGIITGSTRLNQLTGILLWWRMTDDLGLKYGISMSHQRGEDESALHLFAKCPEAINIWNKLGVPQTFDVQNVSNWFFNYINVLKGDLVAKFVVICWAIWNSRNAYVWKGLAVDVDHMLRSSLAFLEKWRHANHIDHPRYTGINTVETHWCRPERGRLKLNTDVALHHENNLMGLGWVLRDDDGRFLASKNVCMPGRFTVTEAEAFSLREALSWLKDSGMGSVDVEMDSQIVYNALHKPSFISAFGMLVDDVKELASMIYDVNFRFVKRSANCAAHTVAREAFSVSGYREWLDTPPLFLVSCLASDLMN